MCLVPAGWTEEQQARVYALVTGVCARAALRHLRRQTAQLPGVPARVLNQQPRQVSQSFLTHSVHSTYRSILSTF